MSELTPYPVAALASVDPVIFRHQILQTMALQYFNFMRGSEEEFTMAHAFEAAHATWDTDWPTDPEPRTLEAAIAVCQDDLAYWGEE